MSDKNKNKGTAGVNPAVAAVTGAIVGGAVVAGAMVLGNEKKRKEIGDKLTNLKDKSVGFVKEGYKIKKDEIVEKIVEGREKVFEKAEGVKEVLADE